MPVKFIPADEDAAILALITAAGVKRLSMSEEDLRQFKLKVDQALGPQSLANFVRAMEKK